MSTHRKKCFPKLSRIRKDLWAWHSDIESLMQGLDAPKKNTLTKEENPEDKLNAKCFEMIHKLCRMSALSPDEIAELLKDADNHRPISRFASSGQLSTRRKSKSPSRPPIRSRTRSISPGRRNPVQDKGTHRGRSPTRRSDVLNCSKADWSRTESTSPDEECRKHLTFDEDDDFFQKSGNRKKKGSPISGKNSKKIVRDLEDQIIELEKENDQLIDEVEKLEKEVQWYKNNRDYWFQYCKDNDRNNKQISRPHHGSSKAEYEGLRKQYEHLHGVYENICQALNKRGSGDTDVEQLQSNAARYRTERNNALLQIQELNDTINWYKGELQNYRTETGHTEKRPKRRYGKRIG